MRQYRRCGYVGVLLVLLGLCGSPALALDPHRAVTQYTLTTWQARDGLPQETLMCVAQTTDGELWLGAPAGLIRFDGSRFRKVPLPPNATSGDHYINDMVAVEDNGLWFSTRDGLYFMQEGRFTRWGTEDGLPPGGALELAMLDDHTLALATVQGVVRFDPKTGLVRSMADLKEMASQALSVSLGRGGRYWAGTMRGLLQLEMVASGKSMVRSENPNEIVNAVLDDSKGRLWVGTSLGLRVLSRNGRSRRYLEGMWVRSLLEDRDGNIWIGTRGNGAWRLSGGVLHGFSVQQGLPDDLVRDLFEDRDGSLWIVTGGGLARLSDGPAVTWTVPEGLPVPFVWSVYEDPSGRLWVGTSGGGVVRMGADGPEPAPFRDPRLVGVEIRSFLTDRDGRFWIGTAGRGLARVDGKRVRWLQWKGNPARNRIYCLQQDRKGTIWIGTGAGLARMDTGGEVRWIDNSPEPAGLTVRSLLEDQDRRLWVGTTTGLFYREGNGLRRAPGTSRLNASRIHQIRGRESGGLWLATDSGIGRYVNGHLSFVNTENGLPNNMIYWLLRDNAGHFWLSCDVGVVRVSVAGVDAACDHRIERLPVLVIGRLDGMKSTECNSGFPAGVRRADGSLWFPTTNGVARVSPREVRRLEQKPPVRIDEVWMDDHLVTPAYLGQDPTLFVPRGVRRVEIRYSAISLLAAEKLVFRYRLEGYDRDWVMAGSVQSAVFTGLPSGAHRFELAARHGLGPWSRPVALTLQVIPGFAETPQFYGLVVLFVALAGWLVDRLRTHRLRVRKAELEREVAGRTAELQDANRRLASLNHLLERLAVRDPLTGLANRRRLDEALQEEARRCVRGKAPMGVLMIDVDHFKLFNDTYGHGAGDRCLQQVAGVIESYARRPSDLAARFGGEEFVLMLPGADKQAVRRIAESLRNEVQGLAIPHEQSPVMPVVTVSIGWECRTPAAGEDPVTLIQEADQYLYRAKRRRNTVAGPDDSTE